MTEHDLFQEVKEDLERQRLEALWKQYGLWVVVAAFCIILATGGGSAYRSWKQSHEQGLTTGLLSADKTGGADVDKNIESLQQFANGNTGTAESDMALLRAGELALEESDKAKAVTFFDKVASNSKADIAFRQLGDLLSVQAQMDTGDVALLSARLQPLTAERATWRYSALEIQGYLALRLGDAAKAKQIFTDLSQSASAPQSIAARAADILRSLN